MIKYLIPMLFLCTIAITTYAQSGKKDTVVLSVYNNNQRYMLYPMPFGKTMPDVDFTAEMVVVLDTVHVFKADTRKDSTGKFPKRWLSERKCGKVPTNVKGKVALLNLNKECDISTQVMRVQDAGALAVIIIHETDDKEKVSLPKKSDKDKYDDDVKVKIPCFTVRTGIGEILARVQPSIVGIKRPKNVGNIQSLAAYRLDSLQAAQSSAKLDSIAKTAYAHYADSLRFNRIGWQVSPNPADGEAVLQYNFLKKATINIDIFNEVGQMFTNYQLFDAQSGKLTIDVTSWQTGAYSVSLRSGSLREVKRLMVTH